MPLERRNLEDLARCERAAFDLFFEVAFGCAFAAVSRRVEKDARAQELAAEALSRAILDLDWILERPAISPDAWLYAHVQAVLGEALSTDAPPTRAAAEGPAR